MKTRIGAALLVLAELMYTLGDVLTTGADSYDKVAPIVADWLRDAWSWISDRMMDTVAFMACCLTLLLGAVMAVKREAPALASGCARQIAGATGAVKSFGYEAQEALSSAWAFRGEILAEGRA